MVSLFAVIVSAVSCGGGSKAKEGELSGNISLSGAFALYPLAVTWAEEFQIMHPHVRIDISAGGAGKGMTDALTNSVDIGMVSRDVYPAEEAKGALAFAVAKDAVVPTINADNPLLEIIMKKGLSCEAATKLWVTGEYTTWGQVLGTGDSSPVHLFSRSDACGAGETWAAWMGSKQEELGGTAVFGDPGVAQVVQQNKLSLGYNNLSYTYDEKTRLPNPGLLIFPLDSNDNGQIDPEELFYSTKDDVIQAIADGRYPSPPARDLYLVTNGVPKREVVAEFLKFILTEGQKYNIPAGYISLSEEKLQAGLKLLGVLAKQQNAEQNQEGELQAE